MALLINKYEEWGYTAKKAGFRQLNASQLSDMKPLCYFSGIVPSLRLSCYLHNPLR
jgi:hypothetical protein